MALDDDISRVKVSIYLDRETHKALKAHYGISIQQQLEAAARELARKDSKEINTISQRKVSSPIATAKGDDVLCVLSQWASQLENISKAMQEFAHGANNPIPGGDVLDATLRYANEAIRSLGGPPARSGEGKAGSGRPRARKLGGQ